MPGRKFVIATGEYYHVFNRGVARQSIFTSQKDYAQALLTLMYYIFSEPPIKLSRYKVLAVADREYILADQRKKNNVLVEIIAFVFMPNHIHFLCKQRVDRGIASFMSKFQNSYTRYFNTKHKRVGPIFQGVFKAVHIETQEQLIHLSRYIHLNPVVSFITNKDGLLSYSWSSFLDYVHGSSDFLSRQPVLDSFKGPEAYKEFVFDQIDYAERLEEIKHLILDDN